MTERLDLSPLVVVCGTNASGKSSLGIELAKEFGGEIISADSRQIFEGFDLCCGKVTAEERAQVPHHLLDVARVGEEFAVSDYQREVYKVIPEIRGRGNLPFIVGGTGLYVDAVVKGYDFTTGEGDRSWRDELEEKSVEELQAMLSPEALSRIQDNPSDFHNKRRLSRLIEKDTKGLNMVPQNRPLGNVLQIGVTWPKELLAERIDERLRIRMEQGMTDEVQTYLDAGGDPEVLYKLGLEYKFITQYLLGEIPTEGEFVKQLSTAIKQFARRQVKWFQRNPEIHWVDMTGDYKSEARALVRDYLDGQKG